MMVLASVRLRICSSIGDQGQVSKEKSSRLGAAARIVPCRLLRPFRNTGRERAIMYGPAARYKMDFHRFEHMRFRGCLRRAV
jgi:hypothetical protein